MAARTGSLYVDLTLNFAKFTDGLDKSRTKATTFGVAVGTVMANVAMSVARMGKDAALALPRLVEHSIDVADSMGKMAQKAQITVESFSALAHAAALSDVSTETLTASLGRFGRNIAEAESGNKKLAAAFRAVGVSANDLKTLGVDQVFAKVAGGFAATQDGARKAQIGFDLFGRSYQDLIPLLNQGTAGITAAIEEAKKLGLVIGGDTAKQAEEFNDNLKKLQGSVSGLGLAIGKELLPKLTALTGAIVDWVKNADAVPRIAGTIADFLHGIVIEAAAVPVAFNGIEVSLLSLEKAFLQAKKVAALGAPGGFLLLPGIEADIKATDAALKQARVDLGNRLNDLDKILHPGTSAKGLTLAKPQGAQPEIIDPESQKKLDSLIASFQKALKPADDLNKELLQLSASGKSSTDILRAYSEEIIKASDAQRANGLTLPPLIGFLDKLAIAQQNQQEWAQKFVETSGRQAIQSTELGDAYVELTAKIDGLKESIAAGNEELERMGLKGRELSTVLEKALPGVDLGDTKMFQIEVEKIDEKVKNVKSSMEELTHTLAQGFEDAIIGGKGFREVLAGIAQDIQRLILRATITGPNGILAGIIGTVGGALGGIFGGGAAAPAANLPVHLASGGIVTKPTFAMIAEGGESEAVIPLSKLRRGGSAQGIVIAPTFNIDARGAEPGAADRLRQVAKEIHDQAVSTTLRAMREMQLRSA